MPAPDQQASANPVVEAPPATLPQAPPVMTASGTPQPIYSKPVFWAVAVPLLLLCSCCLWMRGNVAKVDERQRQEREASEKDAAKFVKDAKAAYQAKQPEDAIRLLGEADRKLLFSHDSPLHTEISGLQSKYQTEAVTPLLAKAQQARQQGDKMGAIALLKQATAARYSSALNRAEATSLLEQLEDRPVPVVQTPPKPDNIGKETPVKPITSKGGVSQETYDQLQTGWSMQQVRDLLGKPTLENQMEIAGLGTVVTWHFQKNSFGFTSAKVVAITVTFHDGLLHDKNWTKME